MNEKKSSEGSASKPTNIVKTKPKKKITEAVAIEQAVESLELGSFKNYLNISVAPLVGVTDEKGPEYITMTEALADDLLEVTEIDHGGSVPNLRVRNLCDRNVLLLDGEELMGAKQNRVLNTTVLVAGQTEVVVPVSCTEQGRWSYKSDKFMDSKIMMAKAVRSSKSSSVSHSLKMHHCYSSDQSQVWEDIHEYQHAPLEFCEVASMSMELVGNEYLEEFYSENDCVRARRQHLEGIISLFPWIATVDAFQHWIYTNPEHSVEDRDNAWNGLLDRFGGDIDWGDYHAARTKMWHRQSHIFLVPFYYIEYGIAQLGALGVWNNSKSDRPKALADYKKALALGGSRPLPELFAAANIPFSFDTEAFKPLIELVQTELAALK